MKKNIRIIIVILICAVAVFSSYSFLNARFSKGTIVNRVEDELNNLDNTGGLVDPLNPLSIDYMREQEYSGSEITIEQTLPSGANYSKYIVSYRSEGLKIYALLTVPSSEKKENGWPVIIFNHGFIQPKEYRTAERYVAYVDAFARAGYIVLKSDYRGHGNSEGEALGSYGSPAYTIDVLNALSSIKRLKDPSTPSGTSTELSRMSRSGPIVDADRIGMWGHSMGGHIAIRSMVISKEIKAGVIWAGVVASYADLLRNWRRGASTPPPLPSGARRWRQTLIERYGEPEKNPEFWNSISANSFLEDISGPVQLHHGTVDTSVPIKFSQDLEGQLRKMNKTVEFYSYEGDDHNIGNNFNTAMQRSIDFFDKYLK